MTAPSTTFAVADIMVALANQENINLLVEGIDDVCAGCVIAADKSLNAFLTDHAVPYNYQIIDGDPIVVVRRAVNNDLVIDYNIAQSDCIKRGTTATIGFKRTDTATLPRAVEIQYTDPDRLFATSTQVARHIGAPTTNASSSYALDFVITGDQARTMAFDTLYRLWSQQLAVTFEYDKDLTIEPGDTILLTCDQGQFLLLVIDVTFTATRSLSIQATALLSAAGVVIASGAPDTGAPSDQIVGYVTLTDSLKHVLFPAPGDSPAVKRNYLRQITIVNSSTTDVIISIYDGSGTSPDVAMDTIAVPKGGTIVRAYKTSPDNGLAATAGHGIYVASNIAVSSIDISAAGFVA